MRKLRPHRLVIYKAGNQAWLADPNNNGRDRVVRPNALLELQSHRGANRQVARQPPSPVKPVVRQLPAHNAHIQLSPVKLRLLKELDLI
jgi:hypothetical protein